MVVIFGAKQADAYKKYVLLCLKVHGEVKALPVYTSHILQRYSKSASTSIRDQSFTGYTGWLTSRTHHFFRGHVSFRQ